MTTTTPQTGPALTAECDESQERRILPTLAQWRAQAPAPIRPRHRGAQRSDDIPREYAQMSDEELERRILAARATLGDRLVILGHHYQREEVIRHADARGDSFKLAQFAANRPEAEYILFCGVHFMAESADILSGPRQTVILPNPAAGCSMADMASIAEVEECWEALDTLLRDEAPEINHREHGEHRGIQREETGKKGLTVVVGQSTSPSSVSSDSSVSSVVDSGLQPVIPVTYMNSAADLKAFCGRNGGIVCTSSNAAKVLQWAFARGRRVLFFPDEHLGRNTALAMGIPEDEIVVWNQRLDFGGIEDDEQLVRARVILWKGWCSTHQRFTPEQIAQARAQFPGVRVVVHPECRREVVEAADQSGSTEYIVKVIEEAPAGTIWAVGTEVNLVKRLANEHPEQTIFCLDPVVCPCSTMYRIHPAYLAWVLEELVAGRVVNQVTVDAETATWARVALERMLANKG